MKKVFGTFILLFIVLSSYTAMAAEPVRVAILPVINSTYTDNQEALLQIEQKINGYFRTPLSSIVPFYSMVPFQDILQEMPKLPDRKAKFAFTEPLLGRIASKVSAEIVIGVKLDQYSSTMIVTRDGNLLEQSDVELSYGIYFKNKKPQYVNQKLQRHYFGEASVQSGADILLSQMMDEVREVLIKNVPMIHY